MILNVNSLWSNKILSVSEFTLEDFRNISFMVETDSDGELYEFLTSKITPHCNAVEKFYALLCARIKFVGETITFAGTSNITINLNIWKDIFEKQYTDIGTCIATGGLIAKLHYPENFWHVTYDDILIDSIVSLSYNDKQIELVGMGIQDKHKLLEKLPITLIEQVGQHIISNCDNKIIFLEPKLGLPELSVNFFNFSAFSIIKTLYNYYTYDNILEMIFMLSKRIPDVGYLNTRTPRDLEFLIDLYRDDVDNGKSDDKLNI